MSLIRIESCSNLQPKDILTTWAPDFGWRKEELWQTYQ
jgi:hypothetical protein